MEGKKYVTVSGIVRKEEYEKLKELCKERGITVNHFVRVAVYRILEKPEEIKPNPFLDAVKKLSQEFERRITELTGEVNEMSKKVNQLEKRIRKRRPKEKPI
jgi:predicted transcriptional regulator